LLIVDAQTRLMPVIDQREQRIKAIGRLLRIADLVAVPVVATEHCSDAIGPTDPVLQAQAKTIRVVQKRTFDATYEPEFDEVLGRIGRRKVVICGAEAHVCVAQTALGLLGLGYSVFLVEDAAGSRHQNDRAAGLGRLRQAGCVPMTVESVAFEWLGSADHHAFKSVLGIIKER